MSDAAGNFQNINAALVANLEKSNKILENMGDILQRNEKNFGKINDSYDDMNKNQKAWNSEMTKGEGIIKKITKGLIDAGKAFLSFLAIKSLGELVHLWKEYSQTTADIAYRMGLGAKGYGQLKDAIKGVTMETGISLEKSMQLTHELARFRVLGADIRGVATDTARFSEVTGVSAEGSARLAGELYKVGGVGAAGVKRLLTNMAQMQRTVGMTEADMEVLGEATIKNTRILAAFGKSGATVESFNKGVIKLAGSFSKVGLSAQDAAAMVDKLMDPTQIEDNALLFSQMGISMEDALTGAIDPATMDKKLSEVGKKIMSMDKYQGAMFAKQMGMTLTQAKQYADMADGVTANTDKSLKEMQGEQLTPGKEMEQTANKVNAALINVIDKLEPILKMISGFFASLTTLLTNPMLLIGLVVAIGVAAMLFRKRMYTVTTDIAKNTATGLTSAVGMSSEKAAIMSEKKFSEGNRRWTEDRKKRIMETYQYQAIQERADHLSMLSNTNTYFKGVIGWSSRVARTASMGVPAASLLNKMTDENNRKMKERYDLTVNEGKLKVESLKLSHSSVAAEKELVEKRIGELLSMEKLDKYQEKELRNLEKAQTAIDKKVRTNEAQQGAMGSKYQEQAANRLLKLSANELSLMKEQAEKRRTAANDLINQAKISKDSLDLEKQIVQQIQKANKEEMEKMLSVKKIEEFTAEEVEKYQKLNGEIKRANTAEQSLTAEIQEQDSAIAKANKEWQKEKDLVDNINKAMKGRTGDIGTLKGYQGLVQRLANAGNSLKGNIASAAGAFADKIKNTGENLKTAFKEVAALGFKGLAARGGGTGLLAAGRGLVTKVNEDGTRSMNALGKGMGALGLIMGLLAGVFMRNQKVMDLLQKVMAIVGDVISSLLDALMPAIKPFLKLLFTLAEVLLWPIVKTLLPMLLTVLGWVLKGLGTVASVFGKNPLSDGLMAASDGMIEAAASISKMDNPFTGMADKIDKLDTTMEKTNENTSAAAREAPTYEATGNGYIKIKDGSSGSAAQEQQAKNTADTANATNKIATDTEKTKQNIEKQVDVAELSVNVLLDMKKEMVKMNSYLASLSGKSLNFT